MTDTLALYDPPCLTCTAYWFVERNLSCKDCCSEYKNYVAVMDMAGITVEDK
jgi:hypothetical protein